MRACPPGDDICRPIARRGQTYRKAGWGIAAWTVLALTIQILGPWAAPRAEVATPRSVLLATTTSVRDSGLLDTLLPLFTEQTGIAVQAVAVGTGAALRMGAEGNADILLTHAPEAEIALVARGAVSERIEIMENYFVLTGPPEDPARVAETPRAADALAKIHAMEFPFVSRADDSGTHKREVALFLSAGIDPEVRWPGLTRTGSGMGISLQVAGQRKAYILSDIGTFLAFRERTGLVALTRPEPELRNVYSVLLVNPKTFPRVRAGEAKQLASFFQSDVARESMGNFGKETFGRPLFRPLTGAESAP